MIELQLSEHAVRYLKEICKRDREFIASIMEMNAGWPSIGTEASYDSLNEIESALPND